jgi:hypothetical protein
LIEGSGNGIVFFSHDIPHAIQSGDKTRWNTVTLGDSIYTVERAPELLAKINLPLIPITNAYEKHPHKQQCRNCKMYFEKNSVLTQVPNHRVISSLVVLLTTAGWLVFGFNGTVIEHAIHGGISTIEHAPHSSHIGCVPST